MRLLLALLVLHLLVRVVMAEELPGTADPAAYLAPLVVDSTAAFQSAVAGGTPLGALMSQGNHPNRAGHDLVAGRLLDWFPAAR